MALPQLGVYLVDPLLLFAGLDLPGPYRACLAYRLIMGWLVPLPLPPPKPPPKPPPEDGLVEDGFATALPRISPPFPAKFPELCPLDPLPKALGTYPPLVLLLLLVVVLLLLLLLLLLFALPVSAIPRATPLPKPLPG